MQGKDRDAEAICSEEITNASPFAQDKPGAFINAARTSCFLVAI
jgi:hypothetical protein